MSVESGYFAEADDAHENYDAIRVRVVADETLAVHTDTSEYGDGQTFAIPVASATSVPVQILNRRPQRHRAIVTGFTLTGVNQILLASRVDFLQGPNPTRGFTLSASNFQLELKNQEPWYAIALGAAQSLSVLDEGWVGG
jgi:hypothetical protein